MKVYINNYRTHWISPYAVLDKIFFWKPWVKDPNVEWPSWYPKVAAMLTPISVVIQKILNKIHPKIDYVKIDRWDTWSMDNTLAQIIHPMLVQLKKEKHGVPSYFAHMKNPRTGKEITMAKAERLWNIELDKMIFAFGELCKDDHEFPYYTPGPKDDPAPWEEGHVGGKWDMKGLEAHNKKIQEGLDAFSRHYRSLWD